MAEVQYHPDDMVVLHPRAFQGLAQQVTVRIVSCQPVSTNGAVRYRVRIPGENFDRTIGRDDIDTLASSGDRARAPEQSSRAKPGSSWINAASIRTRK